MRVCLLFCGFIRNYISGSDLSNYFKTQLPDASIIDIYMYAPDTLDPENPIPVDKYLFESNLLQANLGSVKIVWHKYDSTLFFKKAIELGFDAHSVTLHRYPPSRKLSMIYNYSKTAELAYLSGIEYNLAIVTRFDYVLKAEYNLPKSLANGVYLFRDTFINGVLNYAEDRLFFGTPALIFTLKDFYTNIKDRFTRADMSGEELFSLFFYYRLGKDLLFPTTTTLPKITLKEDLLQKSRNDELMYHESQTHTL